MNGIIRHVAIAMLAKTAEDRSVLVGEFTGLRRRALSGLARGIVAKCAQAMDEKAVSNAHQRRLAAYRAKNRAPARGTAAYAAQQARLAKYKQDMFNARHSPTRELGDSAWATFGKNLSTGAAAMSTGVAQGLAATPGIIGGLVGGVGSFVTGNGWGNGWSAGRDFVDSVGVGNYNLGALKSNLADFQRFNRDVYLDNNDIDVNNASALERAGLYGLGTAEAAGKVLGETIGFGAAGKLMSGGAKVVSNVAGKVLPRASGAAGTAANTAGAAANTAGTAAGTAGTAANAAGAATRAAGTAANTARTAANTAGTAASATGTAVGTAGTAANAAGAVANTASRAANVGKAVKTWGGRAFNAGVGVAAPIASGVNSAENYIHDTQNFMNTPMQGGMVPRDIDISTIL